MSEKRFGGHVLRGGRWVPADLAEEVEEVTEEVLQEEADPLDEFHTGGGWYQVGDEKVQGKDAAREALAALGEEE